MKKIFLFSTVIIALLSCTKTIDVDLKSASPAIVIEGKLGSNAAASIQISKSGPFSSNNTFPGVSGASVNITDDLGKTYWLTEISAGLYTNTTLIGIPGHSYNLSVNIDGKNYTATSTMPAQVKLDTLLMEKLSLMDKMGWAAVPQYTDPAGFGNYYRFIETINGKRYPNYWVWDDRIVNDGISRIPLIQGDSSINLHDTIEVEMQCIDKNMYRYFTALANVQMNATTPANPDSNIRGGALGYFSAYTSSRKKIIVQ